MYGKVLLGMASMHGKNLLYGAKPGYISELDTDTVNNMGTIVNILLATTVTPTCTAEEVETLWEHHSDLTVRIAALSLLVNEIFSYKLQQVVKEVSFLRLPFNYLICTDQYLKYNKR